jgi:hypothetical protein
MNEHRLKNLLRSIVDNDFKPLESPTPREIVHHFYKFLGSTDPELRDELIFSVMANWIYKGVYTQEDIYKIAETLVQDEYILNGIGRENDDSVFVRSATALQLWAIVVTQKKKNFIPFNIIGTIFEKTMRLLQEEIDYRTYVPNKGWANSISHTANILMELVQLPEMKKPWILMILNSICDKVLQPGFRFPGDEIDHLAAPVAEILLREILLEEEILPCFEKMKIQPHFHGQEPENFFRLINVRCFLRAVYFYLLDIPDKRRERDLILLTLQELKSE